MVGYYGTILHSRDQGVTWEIQRSPTRSALFRVRFLGEGKGWIVRELRHPALQRRRRQQLERAVDRHDRTPFRPDRSKRRKRLGLWAVAAPYFVHRMAAVRGSMHRFRKT